MSDRPTRARRFLRDDAYDSILGAIIRGDLPPGAPLRDHELAAELGLSRTPVREALARLIDEGLVETKPNAYTRVAPLDDGPAREAAVVIQALYGLATRLAVPRMNPDHLAAAAGDTDGAVRITEENWATLVALIDVARAATDPATPSTSGPNRADADHTDQPDQTPGDSHVAR